VTEDWRRSSRIGAGSSVTHHDVFVPADLTVLGLALVVVMALGVQRTFHVAPAISDVQVYTKFYRNKKCDKNFIKMTLNTSLSQN